MYLFGQPSVIYAIMNPVIPLLILTHTIYLKIVRNQSFILSIKAFVILPLIFSFWPSLLSFVLS